MTLRNVLLIIFKHLDYQSLIDLLDALNYRYKNFVLNEYLYHKFKIIIDPKCVFDKIYENSIKCSQYKKDLIQNQNIDRIFEFKDEQNYVCSTYDNKFSKLNFSYII